VFRLFTVPDRAGNKLGVRALWGDQTVSGLSRAFKVFVHPEVGRVELTYQFFDVRDALGQQLLVGTPEPGSRSADAIAYAIAQPDNVDVNELIIRPTVQG
jgi:hypothetical protein